jgi:tetratricopeptide (TPR) repeat protein
MHPHARVDGEFFDEAMISAVPRAYPRPQSEWSANEKQFYEKVLTGSRYDVLVAPLQVNGLSFDRATRSVMTAELVTAIAQSQPGRVPDAYLISKAMGEGQREYPRQELYRIANSVGAKRIIWGAVGHDSTGRMSVTILSQRHPDTAVGDATWSTPIESHILSNITSNDQHPAIEAFALRIPELLRSIGIDPAAVGAHQLVSQLDIDVLPSSPLDLMTDNDNPARNAYILLLFGSLTPAHMEKAKEHFVEKAVLAIARLSTAAPEYRALRARAYMMMGYRAAAIQSLGAAVTGEEEEVRAVLDGNLPEVRTQAAKERNALKRLIAELDANRIAADYGVVSSSQSIEAVKALDLPGRLWPFLAARAFTDWDFWSQFDNASLKAIIDHEFPLKDYSLEDLTRGALSVGNADKLRTVIDLSVFNHMRKYVEEHAAQCCDLSSVRFDRFDYMGFLSALGDDNLIRHIGFLSHVQRMPLDALQYADAIQPVYKGYPYYALARSEAERAAADDSGGAEREGLMKTAYEDVFNALYWEQTQSLISSRAMTDLGSSFQQHEYGYFDNFYYTELPYHPLYMTWANGGNSATIRANGLAALGNATSQFDAVLQFVGSYAATSADQALADEVVRQIQGRFLGSPARGEFLADQEVLRGNTAAAEALLRDVIKMVPEYGQAYLSLGKLTFESGEVKEAARVFRSFPGLRQDSKANRVSIANDAHDMGSYFFNSGDFDLAKPFYSIAVAQDTGAGAEMAATMRLSLLAGDIRGALSSALERAQRYHDSHAYRDYLGMLHATGHSQDAWAGFGTLVRELPEPDIWETALVGHHMAGSTETEVTEWVKQSDLQRAGNHVSYATTYLARFATTDRIPSKGLATVIADIDRPTWQFDTGALSVVRPDADGINQRILGPAGAVTPQGVLPIGVFDHGGPKHRVRSELSYFVEAYRALKLGDFKQAKRVFDEAAALYDMASSQSSYMLPYYALASAKAGTDASGVEKILSRFTQKEQRFEYQLANAVLEGVGGNIRKSLRSLQLARYRRPNNGEGVQVSQYSYADICESLYRLSGSVEIRTVALDWARARETAEPWQSWSYALVAALTPDPVERQKAIAMAHYLDPKSVHLSSFKKSEIDEAVRMFGSVNIFLGKKHGAVNEVTT